MRPPAIVTTVDDVIVWSHEQWRRVVSLVLSVVDVVALVMTVANGHGPVRFVLGLVVGVVIPGWCVIGWLRLPDPFLEASLSIALSLALIMLSAQMMMTVHWWHLAGFEILLCAVSLPVLVWLARRRSVAS